MSLLSLAVQGIRDEQQSAEIFGKSIPGTGQTVFLQYDFDAKLGIDGAAVTVTETGEKAYRVSIPEFSFIGYDEPSFRVAVEDGDILSWATLEIETSYEFRS